MDSRWRRLHDTAMRQEGHVTTRQVEAAGLTRPALHDQVTSGLLAYTAPARTFLDLLAAPPSRASGARSSSRRPDVRYHDTIAFRQALTDRLRRQYPDQAVGRLQKRAVMERFLDRVAEALPDNARLKGGYALELRLKAHPTAANA